MKDGGYGRLLGLHGAIAFDWIESEALARNGLGDPSTKPVVVYTPPGYESEGSRRYPVIYVLHGYTGDTARLVSAGAWDRNVFQWADHLIHERAMPPLIVVGVDGFTRLGGSQYVDSMQNGNYATYVVRDVVAHVDKNYRTSACEGGRAVVGKSSGGFGAMHLVMEHPGTFAAFASHSGDAYFRESFPPGFPIAQRTLERHNFELRSFLDVFERKPKRGQSDFDTLMILAMAAAYSPRSASPLDVELPFDQKTGEIRDDVFAKWLAFDPVERVAAKAKELGRLRLRYLDCGRRDEYNLDIGARIAVSRMRECGLEVRHEEFDDDHRNVGYRYAISLPALAAVLDERP